MNISPQLALLLYMEIKGAVVAAIRARKNDPEYQPTDVEVMAELNTNVQQGLSEGAAWKAAHPTDPAS